MDGHLNMLLEKTDPVDRPIKSESEALDPLQGHVSGEFECSSDSPEECEMEWAEFVKETKRQWADPAPGRLKRFARYFYDRFIRLHGSEKQIAWGTALGFFVAMTPTMGFQMLIAVPIAAFFKISKVASAAGVWLTNPFTAPFLYWVNYKVGAKILGFPVNEGFLANPSWDTFIRSGTHTILSLIVGGFVTGLIVAIPGYFITLYAVKAARREAAILKEKRKKKKQQG
jgi:hypothetical protein